MNMELKTTGIDNVLKRLDTYKKQIPSKMKLLMERLAVIGAYRARVDFSAAMYAGENDVEVTVNAIANGYEVVASGKSVLFIEFGTGVINPEHPKSGEFGFAHGTYGQGKGANPNGWVYVGEQGNAGQTVREGVYRTRGNPPAKAMYNSSEEVRRRIQEVAREVFNG